MKKKLHFQEKNDTSHIGDKQYDWQQISSHKQWRPEDTGTSIQKAEKNDIQ